MEILALVEAEDHVCCRYRIAAFRPAFEAAGHILKIVPLPKSWWSRRAIFKRCSSAEVVILQRKLLSPWELPRLRRFSKKLVFDFDDALWLRDSHSGKGFDDAKRCRRFRAITNAADTMVAGNRILAEHAGLKAVVIPTCVDVEKYRPVARTADNAVSLVWVGSSSTLKGLEQRRELFEKLGRAIPGLRLKIICDRFPAFDNLAIDAVPWSEATEATEIASADIGIAWVPDDPWSRGKCGLKILQFQAAGLPVVANPVGVQADMVKSGITGFAATTDDEWIAAIQTLAADAGLRDRLGRAGREQVETEYSVPVGAKLWLDLLRRIAPC